MRLGPILAVALVVAGDLAADVKSVAAEKDALSLFADLLGKAARTGDPDGEMAAFLVREQDGRLRCLLWPRLARRRSEAFTGMLPLGVIAVVHTHPGVMPEPSRNDRTEAKRLGLPIYVLTSRTVFVADPDTGQSVNLVGRTNWSRGTSPRACESGWGGSNSARAASQ
jgi:JAB domain-containing protein similar to deubiquitination enzymes